MSITQLNLLKLIAKELGYSGGTVSTAGTTTTLIDTSSDSPMDPDDDDGAFKNAWAMIESNSSGSDNVAECRRVSSYTPGTATIDLPSGRGFTAATTTTMAYGIYQHVPPTRIGVNKGLDEYINEVLRNLVYRTDSLFTLITDGDMETSGVTNWTASNATRAKSTTTGITHGLQSLQVTNSSADGYARTASITVNSGSSYDLCADVTVASGTVTLQAYDATNSAEIDSDSTTSGNAVTIGVTFNVPNDCTSLQIRLVGTEATADAYWDNLSLRPSNQSIFQLPSWFTTSGMLESAQIFGGGSEISAGGVPVREHHYEQMQWARVIEDETGYVPFLLKLNQLVDNKYHLFIRGLRPYAEFTSPPTSTSLSSSTTANQDLVKAWVLSRVFTNLGQKDKAKYWHEEAKQLYLQLAPIKPILMQLSEPF